MEKLFSNLIKIGSRPYKRKAFDIIKFKADVSIGFMSNIINSKDNYFSVFNCPSAIIKQDYKRKDRVRFELPDNIYCSTKIIEIKINKIVTIYRNYNIVEIVLDSSFNCKDSENKHVKNFLVNFDDQLIRNWVLKPIIRIILKDNSQTDELIQILTFSKNNINKKYAGKQILKKDLILRYEDYKTLFENRQEEFLKIIEKLPDLIQFYVFVLISSKVLYKPIDIPKRFLDFILMESLNPDHKSKIIHAFEMIVIKKEIENEILLDIFIKICSKNSFYPINKDPRMKIKKIFITPNQIYFDSYSGEDPNRILNNYKKHTDRFIRVSLSNDKFDKLNYLLDYVAIINSFFKEFLNKGLKIGNKFFKFFGYSNSQLRSHSFWLLNESSDLNFEIIHNENGDFSAERNTSKNASRRGQLLTTSKFFGAIEKIIEIPDFEIVLNDENDFCKEAKVNICLKKEYNFTDGIGLISLDLARKAANLLKKDYASAFQIRIGGVKGILAVDLNLPKDTICIRPSMKKFKSTKIDLYLIRASSYTPGFLNRQIIILLEYLGVAKETFLELQKNQINSSKRILNLNFVEQDLDCQKINSMMKNLLLECVENKNKENLKKDPFIFGVANTLFLSMIELLKNKTQIHVPDSGRFIGIIDETGVLEENQVFLRTCLDPKQPDPFYSKEFSKFKVIKGKVIVTKNPCLYPGDIRFCEAVDDIRLYHYVNVIVFPKKGIRPLQQLISDGDLDGDVYFVSWDKNLILDVPFNKFPSIAYWDKFNNIAIDIPKDEISEVTRDKIIDFFCNYLRNDILGLVCNRHLALSDLEDPYSRSCKILACYSNAALNFGKHGKNVSYASLKQYTISSYPDFMEKKGKNDPYQSQKALGHCYRMIKEVYDKFTNNIKKSKIDFIPNKSLLEKGFEIFLDLAEINLCKVYRNDLQSTLKHFNLNSEFEFFSGICIKFKNNKFGKDNFENIQSMKDAAKTFIEYYKDCFDIIIYNLFIYFTTDLKITNLDYLDFIQNIDTETLNEIEQIFEQKVLNYFDDNEYKNKLKFKILEIQSNKFFKIIKNLFLSACIFSSYRNYFEIEKLSILNKVILNRYLTKNSIVKNKNVDNRWRDISHYDFISEPVFDLNMWDYSDNDNYRIKKGSGNRNRKLFHSLPWILDSSYMINNY